MPQLYWFLVGLGALGLAACIVLLTRPELVTRQVSVLNSRFPEAEELVSAAASTASSSPKTSDHVAASPPQTAPEAESEGNTVIAEKPPSSAPLTATSSSETTTIVRPQPVYYSPSLSVAELNEITRAALVNILCESNGNPIHSTSGSGVIIDPRGIILTNAHVAQYFLLEERPETPVSCIVRTGSPAHATWHAELLFFPSQWLEEHANDILKTKPLGTGEHDYALLYVTGATSEPLPLSFPFLPIDTNEAAGFTGDQVLAAAYPAEFMRGSSARDSLNVASTVTQIHQMLTFSERLVDLISLGGTVVAQGGSSGGAVVDLWGNLIALIVTTSEGDTTATRDLRAVTMAHIDRSLTEHTGVGIKAFLGKSPVSLASDFKENDAPALSAALTRAIEEKRD